MDPAAGMPALWNEPTATRHPEFWFDDGSLVVSVEAVMFKVHRTVLTRHSSFISELEENRLNRDGPGSKFVWVHYVELDPSKKVTAADFEVLLQHLYHDIPLSQDTPFPRIASILRVSSPGQLHFPRIHETAMRYFVDLFPSGPVPFFHPGHLEEALALSTSLNITSVQKGILYSLVTSTNFDTEAADATTDGDLRTQPSSDYDPEPEKASVLGNTDPLVPAPESVPHLAVADSPSAAHKYVLSPLDSQRCMRLMTHLIDHFSPILFTSPATPHMACTDVFADTWMKVVIQPAIDDQGVYKPLETLERIKRVDWAKAGLCSACVIEKNAEWTEEQEVIWRSMDQWLGL
ncbi:hypothetical protein DFH07DRAFT_872713 [Mycena maculata]|uniref:BTB domain-containing protein n=1 Tax=Mycena maculata TaxID=230809 RepID=A0AAD7H920_9AGAR|nr:hypothetical protein DFH07DRAFT_872713 [Mycena maculata]